MSINNDKLRRFMYDTFRENNIFYANDLVGTDFKQVIDFEIKRQYYNSEVSIMVNNEDKCDLNYKNVKEHDIKNVVYMGKFIVLDMIIKRMRSCNTKEFIEYSKLFKELYESKDGEKHE